MTTLLFLVLAACTTTPSDTASDTAGTPVWPGAELVWEDAPTLPAGQLPPPGDFDLSINVLAPGQPITFTVTNGPPNTSLHVGYSFDGVGNGPCPTVLNGACAGIRSAVRLVPGAFSTNTAGEATHTLTLPNILPTDIAFQAVSPSTAELSNVVTGYIFPVGTSTDATLDRDGDTFSHADGDCNDNDNAIHPGASDVVGDYVDSDCDGADASAADPEGDGFYLADNGITVVCPDAAVGDTGVVNGVTYTKRDRDFLKNNAAAGDFETACTTGLTDLSTMFISDSSFNEDISSWDVSDVTNMSFTFGAAYAFNQDISAWDTSSVTDMSFMFSYSEAFNADISGWDVSNVTTMYYMFNDAYAFNQDLTDWDVSSVTIMNGMFYAATAFNGDIGSWDVSSVTSMDGMFEGATSYNQDLSSWDVSNATDMTAMFAFSGFNQDISGWQVGNVTTMHAMFEGSSFNYDIGSWDVSNVTDMLAMFDGATAFNQDLSGWCLPNFTSEPEDFATGASSWTLPQPLWGDTDCDGFVGPNPDPEGDGFYLADNGITVVCPDAAMGDMGVVDGVTYTKRDRDYLMNTAVAGEYETACTSGITDMSSMFAAYLGFNADIGSWDVSSVTNMGSMFYYSSFNQDVGAWDVSNVTNMTNMFGTSPFNQDIGAWDVSNVTNMSFMFYGTAFSQDISAWDVSSVTDMSAMFASNTGFYGTIGGWDVSNVTNMSSMFDSSSYTGDISAWDVSNVTNMDFMFHLNGDFDTDLTGWCVPNIASEPYNFTYGATSWLPTFQPLWGDTDCDGV
ncbi:MAG: BspA family leucine-rich repeat surface protein, partial [Myxococcota bacterium]